MCRFESTERAALRPAHGRPPFVQVREYVRKVPSDAHVVVDTNHYSVPWSAIGKRVQVQVTEAEVVIYQSDGTELARHVLQPGTHQKSTDKEHLRGIMYCGGEGESSSLRVVMTDELSGPLRIEAPRHGDSRRHERAAKGGENLPPGGCRRYRSRHRGDGTGEIGRAHV